MYLQVASLILWGIFGRKFNALQHTLLYYCAELFFVLRKVIQPFIYKVILMIIQGGILLI